MYEFHLEDNWYDEYTLQKVWKELDLYTNPGVFVKASKEPSTAKSDGQTLAENGRVFLNEIYLPRGRLISPILNHIDKIHCKEFSDKIEKEIPNARNFKDTNTNATIVSYYENSDHYKPHYDTGMFTALIWLFREPKKFEGGDLYLPDIDTTIELKNNRMIFFPSWYLHEVKPIQMAPTNEVGWGRYTITHFFTNNF